MSALIRPSDLYPLETARLRLVPLATGDAEDICREIDRPDITRNLLSVPSPYRIEHAMFFTRLAESNWRERNGHLPYAVRLRTTGAFAGVISIDTPDTHRRTEVGYWLARNYWGHGYATEALRAVIAVGFEVLKANRIHANYFVGNPASRRVMEKVGMTYEGVQRGYFRKGDTFVDVGWCAILAEDYVRPHTERVVDRNA